ncbi:MAG TPA: type IV pilus biogenesis/stability protein PilW [Steroidobacteraceae bacterium]|jgi:type IV pilus assembly protein PilF|nr:type IV pilus biogenesis/stability protein PilW [Steroidobacteraceae bacterium]
MTGQRLVMRPRRRVAATARGTRGCVPAAATARWAVLAAAGLAVAALGGCASSTTERPSNDSDAARINVQLGIDYLQRGELALAQTKLQRALGEDAHNPDVHEALAMLDERLGKVGEADKEYRRALDLSQRAPAILNGYAVYLCSHGRATEGVRMFEEAAGNALYRTPWVAYTNAGVCLRTVHRDPEAMQRFMRALQIDPAYSEAVFQAAQTGFSLRQYQQARERIDTYLATNAATPDLLLLGWRVAGAQKDVRGQQFYASRLSQEFPTSQQAHTLQLAAAEGNSD